jgi:hypothetical protein
MTEKEVGGRRNKPSSLHKRILTKAITKPQDFISLTHQCISLYFT